MSREIKFRAWDKTTEEMIYLDKASAYELTFSKQHGWTLTVDEGSLLVCDESDMELMEYTGLKDCDGVEIYEGDILEYFFSKDDSLRDTGIVEFKEYRGWPQFWVRSIPGDDFLAYYPDVEMRMKVIGNIYENPELLEVK